MTDPEIKMANGLRALIDREAHILKYWYDECAREGQAGSSYQRTYAACYNQLVSLRTRLSCDMMDIEKFTTPNTDIPAATTFIYARAKDKNPGTDI